MKTNKNVKKAGALAGIIIVILVLSIGILASGIFEVNGGDPPQFPRDHLSVDASFLLKTDETNESVNVTCDLYLTNSWEKVSNEIKIIAYVIEKNSNLAIFKNTVEFGKIAADATTELNIPLEFSDNSYKVEILIFENEKIVMKGQTSITSNQRYFYDVHGKRVYNAGYFASPELDDEQWEVNYSLLSIEKLN